jgi:vancomycin permeability regulator SanA
LGNRWLRASSVVFCLLLGWLGISAFGIAGSVAPFVSADRAKLPSTRVALVLGCAPRMTDGRSNLFFERRIQAAAYAAGDVGGPEGLRVRLREVVSRLAAVLDVRVLRTTPRFPGPREVTPLIRGHDE